MSIGIGTQLGSHEITALLGKGGMGEVYRARDTKLKREVAIKILPDEFARDPERISRFEREAEVLASLNHPNIAAIYDLQEADGWRFLVLELVEGETLADRLSRGPIPVQQALQIGKHICEALEAAHDKGIIHRDLKPGNVKASTDGQVKVLDFGLAKALEATPAASSISNSPTLTFAGTNAGVILGTAAYMSPEQARGRAADRRTDVFSFGCVLYEMLTGRQAFQGEDVSDVLASVLKTEPDLSLLPANLHPKIEDALRRCLQKNPRMRWHAIGDVRVEIEAILADPRGAVVADREAIAVKTRLWRWATAMAAAVILAAVITGVAVWNLKPAIPLPITRFSLTLGEGQQFGNPGVTEIAISPDGRQIIYEANRQLYQRLMSESEARPITGTQALQNLATPIFSPDGGYVAFWSLGDLAIKKIAVTGGPLATICPTSNFFGGSWDESGIVFANRTGVMRVAASGGKPETLIEAENDEAFYGPQILPGTDAVLFSVAKGQGAAWDNAQVVVQSLKSKDRKILVERGTDGRYVPTGHIVYAAGGTLFGVPFDLRALAVTAGVVPLLEGVRATTFQFGGAFQFNFSKSGTLTYIPGPRTSTGEQLLLALMDRKGKIEALKLPVRAYGFPRVSRNGKRIAFATDNVQGAHIWIYDRTGTTAPRQLTIGGANRFPVWSPDGQWIAYQSDREGDLAIFRQRTDGTDSPERISKPEKGVAHIPESWSSDGETLSFTEAKGNDAALWTFSFKEKKASLFAGTPPTAQGLSLRFVGRSAFSPDGRWLAYQSNESGRAQIWVQPFPATRAKYLVTEGTHPFWSADGKELLFRSGDLLMATNISTNPDFAFSNPTPIASGLINVASTAGPRNFDIAPDGNFIGVINPSPTTSGVPAAPQIEVVLGWFEEIKQRMSVK